MGEKISGYTGISTSTFADDDLFDISVFTGSGYVTRKITGAQLKAGLSSSSLATDDQVINQAERNIDLNGTSSTDKLNIRNNLGEEIATFQGDKLVNVGEFYVKDGENLGLNTDNPLARLEINTNGQADVIKTGTNTEQRFILDYLGKLGIGQATPTSALHVQSKYGNPTMYVRHTGAFQTSATFENTRDDRQTLIQLKNDLGNVINLSSRGSNFANFPDCAVLMINSKDLVFTQGSNEFLRFTSTGEIEIDGDTGLTGTYTFGGGSSGDVASMTYKKGILVEVTTVP